MIGTFICCVLSFGLFMLDFVSMSEFIKIDDDCCTDDLNTNNNEDDTGGNSN